MRICLPLQSETIEGKAALNGHFGSAPAFLVYDTETQQKELIKNDNGQHDHGQCQPVALLKAQRVDCVVCVGMGRGALLKLNKAGIQVYACDATTVQQALEDALACKVIHFTHGQCCAHSGCHSH